MACTALLALWTPRKQHSCIILRYLETGSLSSSLEISILLQAFGSMRWEGRSYTRPFTILVAAYHHSKQRCYLKPSIQPVERADTARWYPYKPGDIKLETRRQWCTTTTSNPDYPAFMLDFCHLKPIFFTSLSWSQLLVWRKIRSNRLLNPSCSNGISQRGTYHPQCPKDQTIFF